MPNSYPIHETTYASGISYRAFRLINLHASLKLFKVKTNFWMKKNLSLVWLVKVSFLIFLQERDKRKLVANYLTECFDLLTNTTLIVAYFIANVTDLWIWHLTNHRPWLHVPSSVSWVWTETSSYQIKQKWNVNIFIFVDEMLHCCSLGWGLLGSH